MRHSSLVALHRDGVSEGQFKDVLKHEYQAIRDVSATGGGGVSVGTIRWWILLFTLVFGSANK